MSGSSDWDVVYLMGEFLPEFTEADALMPLDGVLSDSLISELMQNAFEKGKWKGKLMGLVTNYHTNYYYYRKDLLKEAGCNLASLGIESGNDYLRNEILKRNMMIHSCQNFMINQ